MKKIKKHSVRYLSFLCGRSDCVDLMLMVLILDSSETSLVSDVSLWPASSDTSGLSSTDRETGQAQLY